MRKYPTPSLEKDYFTLDTTKWNTWQKANWKTNWTQQSHQRSKNKLGKQLKRGTLNNNRTWINLKSPNNKYKKWNASMHKQTTTLLQKYYLHFTQPNRTTQQTQTVKQTQLSQKQSRKVSKKPKRKMENNTKKAIKQIQAPQKQPCKCKT